ncbi:hypothetical protein IPZ58_07660 [Streptomyces roseoverticillatus]|uniref:hypothetical protein n=1 Tax=Streptomyces roseoverticillatus TaxID=66429 RepID=UPI001F3BD939|nr:hypothetical protein [Streptomyces roseoverticillatus]MCF3101456.1 hypothetical protein [Streptomyces roseoverticillatus]
MRDPKKQKASIELRKLWGDMEDAMALPPGQPRSLTCDAVETRIKELTPLAGATHWATVPIRLLELGVYQRIHAELGVAAHIDMDTMLACRSIFRGPGGRL